MTSYLITLGAVDSLAQGYNSIVWNIHRAIFYKLCFTTSNFGGMYNHRYYRLRYVVYSMHGITMQYFCVKLLRNAYKALSISARAKLIMV